MEGGRPFFPERPEVFVVVIALRKSSKFGEQRRERGFLTFTERTMRGAHGRSNTERSCGGYLARDLDRTVKLLSGRGHVLNEPHSIGLVGVPFIACQHVAHRICPTNLSDKCDRCTPGREVTAGNFWLREHGIACCNSDIGGEKKLVACALALALDGHNEWLLSTRRDSADWIYELGNLWEFAATQDWCPAFGIEDASNEVGTLGIEHSDTQSIIVVEHIHQTAQADNARQFDAVIILPNADHQD
jgi:hypothetical protein